MTRWQKKSAELEAKVREGVRLLKIEDPEKYQQLVDASQALYDGFVRMRFEEAKGL